MKAFPVSFTFEKKHLLPIDLNVLFQDFERLAPKNRRAFTLFLNSPYFVSEKDMAQLSHDFADLYPKFLRFKKGGYLEMRFQFKKQFKEGHFPQHLEEATEQLRQRLRRLHAQLLHFFRQNYVDNHPTLTDGLDLIINRQRGVVNPDEDYQIILDSIEASTPSISKALEQLSFSYASYFQENRKRGPVEVATFSRLKGQFAQFTEMVEQKISIEEKYWETVSHQGLPSPAMASTANWAYWQEIYVSLRRLIEEQKDLDNSHYHTLKATIFDRKLPFAPEDQLYILETIQNYLSRVAKAGAVGVRQEQYDWINFRRQNDLLVFNRIISVHTFLNITAIYGKMGQFQEAQAFLQEYGERLFPPNRDLGVWMGELIVAFHKKQYRKVLEAFEYKRKTDLSNELKGMDYYFRLTYMRFCASLWLVIHDGAEDEEAEERFARAEHNYRRYLSDRAKKNGTSVADSPELSAYQNSLSLGVKIYGSYKKGNLAAQRASLLDQVRNTHPLNAKEWLIELLEHVTGF